MKHDELERRILESARGYNEPPEPPREAMWESIRASLDAGDDARPDIEPGGGRRSDSLRRLRRWTPWALGLAAAATLAVGFGLGRITSPEPGSPAPVAADEGPSDGRDAGPSLAARLAVADHLVETEAMLTLYRTAGRDTDRQATAEWARDLLSTTRMMMDSRAGRDPELMQLFGDLELVLVQIANAAESDTDQELIEEGIEERQLMTQIRSASAPLDMAL